MKINQYECPDCGYMIDVGLYSRLITAQKSCFNKKCETNPRDYNLIKPGDESVFVKTMYKKHPEGFTVTLPNGAVIGYDPAVKS